MDQRLQDLVVIKDPDPRSPARPVGVWPGAKGGPLHGNAMIIKTATEQLLSNAYDIRENRNYGPAEAGRRIREAAGTVLGRMNTAAESLRTADAALGQQLRSASATPGYERTGHWQPSFDMRLVEHYASMQSGAKAGVRHQLLREPLAHFEIADALQRVPLPLSGITWAERNAIRVALFRQMRPDEFEALDMQRQQNALAHALLRESVKAVQSVSGTNQDLVTHALTAYEYGTQGQPASWGDMPAELNA